MQFGPRILGLNAGIFGTGFQTVIGLYVLLSVIANMNNLLVVCKFYYYMHI